MIILCCFNQEIQVPPRNTLCNIVHLLFTQELLLYFRPLITVQETLASLQEF